MTCRCLVKLLAAFLLHVFIHYATEKLERRNGLLHTTVKALIKVPLQ